MAWVKKRYRTKAGWRYAVGYSDHACVERTHGGFTSATAASSWADRALQLAQLLSGGASGPIGDPTGQPPDPVRNLAPRDLPPNFRIEHPLHALGSPYHRLT